MKRPLMPELVTQCSNILTGTSLGVCHMLVCPQHVVETVFKDSLEQDQEAPQPTENPFLKAKCQKLLACRLTLRSH